MLSEPLFHRLLSDCQPRWRPERISTELMPSPLLAHGQFSGSEGPICISADVVSSLDGMKIIQKLIIDKLGLHYTTMRADDGKPDACKAKKKKKCNFLQWRSLGNGRNQIGKSGGIFVQG